MRQRCISCGRQTYSPCAWCGPRVPTPLAQPEGVVKRSAPKIPRHKSATRAGLCAVCGERHRGRIGSAIDAMERVLTLAIEHGETTVQLGNVIFWKHFIHEALNLRSRR